VEDRNFHDIFADYFYDLDFDEFQLFEKNDVKFNDTDVKNDLRKDWELQ